MELTFNKVDNWYEAEFEITDDINLHIELNVAAPIKLYQKTSGDEYDLVQAFKPSIDKVLDTDLMALVYPKWIKVVSEAEVTMGIVTFTGDAPSGGGETEELKRNDVNFFDYDGTLLYSYSWEKARNLTELPAAPSHDGMTFKEWNYTLEDIKEQGTDTYIGKADVGACFVDGNGDAVANPLNVLIIPRGVETLTDNDGFGSKTWCTVASVVSIPNTVTYIDDNFVGSAIVLCELKIPHRCVLDNGYPAIGGCAMASFYFNGATIIDEGFSYISMGARPFSLQEGVTEFAAKIEKGYIKMPSSISYVDGKATSDFIGAYDFSSHLEIPDYDYRNTYKYFHVIVPDNLYDEWVSHTNWSFIADYIIPASRYNLNII